jgi:hypothetical protein
MDYLDVVYRHLACFRGRGLTFDELTTTYIQFVFRKREMPGTTRG